jgi:glyoxylase-like metal-dependent hydrolase (beta-lactamase superfamily II)
VATHHTNPPLEDELGDVLEKAMHRAGLNDESLAVRSDVRAGRILDAIDYRSDLTTPELRRLAEVLGLNEVGLCALGTGHYPQPEIGALPFCVWPLHMPHGIGVANAYLVGECGSDRAVLFDTGTGIGALDSVWPDSIRRLDAVFLTHIEAEHSGALSEVITRFDVHTAFVPAGAEIARGHPIGEGEEKIFGPLAITAYATPGHAAAHNCYLVRAPAVKTGGMLLISGDLVFAGSAGGGYFSHTQLQTNLRRVLKAVPPSTVIAPGHGPLTTVANELRYNPFVI